MLRSILDRFPVQTSNKSDFEKDWDRRVEDQHNSAMISKYHPMPQSVLEASNERFSSNSYRSFKFDVLRAAYQRAVVPVRVLYATGVTLVIEESHVSPSHIIETVCQFRLDAMEAALNDTPADLLILLSEADLPCPDSWEDRSGWSEEAFAGADDIMRHNSPYRHGLALLLKRLDTSRADFLAFKEAAALIMEHSLFHKEKGEDGSVEVKLQYIMADIFPSLREKERYLLERHAILMRRSEDGDNPVVPDNKIGVDGFF